MKTLPRGYRNHRCPGCQLPKQLCICHLVPQLAINSKFWVLMHPFEYDKPTNTGRIIKDCIPETEIIFWDRQQPAEDLLEMIKSGNPTYLIFPKEYQTNTNSVTSRLPKPKGLVNFILIDGTWKQARKIFRKSPYLHDLIMFSFHSNQKSIYQLRQSEHSHHLCTIEVAINVLRENQELIAANKLEKYFSSFINRYVYHRNGYFPFETIDLSNHVS